MNEIRISGLTVLFLGVALLIFTFICAYQFLMGVLEIAASEDLMKLFGEALAPLISYAVRTLYLGIMGWVGSILTRRGVQILAATEKAEKISGKTKATEEQAV